MRIHIPFRSDNGHRARLWVACEARWRDLFPAAEIVTGDHQGDPFNRSAARNAAARGDWDVAVFADADVMPETAEQVLAAVDHACTTGQLTYAHTWRAALGPAATERVLAGAGPACVEHDEWHINTFSSCYAVTRSLWEAVGGFDERFVGWGFEDLAFMRACGALGGMNRVDGNVYHLWHPRSRETEEGQPHYKANEALWERYVQAGWDGNAMRALLAHERIGAQ